MMLPRKVKETAEWKRASGEFSVITVPAAIYNASLITELINKEVDVEERKCMAKGDRYCEFIAVNP
jgi:hypothetical protein